MDIKTRSFYESLEEIPIYNFYKCYKGDLKYILLDRNEVITEYIEKVWDELLNEYHKLTVNNDALNYYNTVLDALWLKTRLFHAPILINTALKATKESKEDIFKELKKWKLPINKTEDIEECLTILNNSKTKLKRKNEEIENYKKQNYDVKDTGMSLETQVINIYKALGYKLDIHKDSIKFLIACYKQIEKLSNKKNG